MVNDYIAFLPNKRTLTVVLNNGTEKAFPIGLNISVDLFNRIISSLLSLKDNQNSGVIAETLSELTYDLLVEYSPDITQEYILKNIDLHSQLEIVETVHKEIQSILKSECFSLPNVDKILDGIKKEKPAAKTDSEKERNFKRERIKSLQADLKEYNDYNLIDDIAILSNKTSNSFSEIMAMPIFVFRDMVRSVILSELRNDDDYNLAYLTYLKFKYITDDSIPKKKKGINMKNFN